MLDKKANIKVSISCITYNHEPYIRECLDGFMMQQCDFDFEVLIHDDASTDGTQEIIKEYQDKYPEIIKPIFQTENQWSKGVRMIGTKFNVPRAKGKYIALCEGDDYWTDPLKLQKQVEFMKANPSVIFCFHGCLRKLEDKNIIIPYVGLKKFQNMKFIKKKLLFKRLGGTFATATSLFNIELCEFINEYSEFFVNGDEALLFAAIQKGEIGYISDVMAVYRTSDSNWSSKNNHYSEKLKNYELFIFNVSKLLKKNIKEEYKENLKITISHKTYQILIAKVNYTHDKVEVFRFYKSLRKRLKPIDTLKFFYRWILN